MISSATGHFPRIIRDQNKTWLFNPVLKKRFSNRPEERVRLNWVEYLVQQTEWKKSRIGFEAPVNLYHDSSTLRADLVLYNQNMDPHILVECKAESVSLTPAVAEQAARYNSRVQAPYLVLTNGVQDFWFKQRNGQVRQTESPLEQVKPLNNVYQAKGYWQERGFCSAGSSSQLKTRLNKALAVFLAGRNSGETRFLNFNESFLPFAMNHYYRIFAVNKNTKLAAGFLGTPGTGSFLVGILNKKGVNKGVVTLHLDAMEQGENSSATLFDGKNPGQHPDAHKLLPASFLEFEPETVEKLPLFLMRFFD